jgi:hypothetical protein
MVSLKSWVRGITGSPVSSPFVIAPEFLRRRDILLLPFFRAADDDALSVPAENAVAGSVHGR